MNRAWNGPAAIAAGLLIALLAGAWLMHETRGTTLWFDEWLWALEYRDGLHTFIAPHNGHPTLVPFTIYRLLFATVGIDHSAPYRLVGIAGHLLVVTLLYVYAARRAGAAVGFLAAGSILLLGPGWQNIIWPLQIGWPISIACGLGGLLAVVALALLAWRLWRIGTGSDCVLTASEPAPPASERVLTARGHGASVGSCRFADRLPRRPARAVSRPAARAC